MKIKFATALLAVAMMNPLSAIASQHNVTKDSTCIFTSRTLCVETDAEYEITDDGDYTYITFLSDGSASFEISGRFRENTEIYFNGRYTILDEENVDGVSIVGDINRDGQNNIADCLVLKKYLSNNEPLDIMSVCRGDINRDSTTDIFDLCLLKREVLHE